MTGPEAAATGSATRPKRAAAILLLKGMQTFSLPRTITVRLQAVTACHIAMRFVRRRRLRNVRPLLPHPSTAVQITTIGWGVGEHDLEQLAEELTDARIVRAARLNPRGGFRHRLVVSTLPGIDMEWAGPGRARPRLGSRTCA